MRAGRLRPAPLREVQLVERGQVLLELGNARRADERRGHARVAKRPGERHLREGLAPGSRDLVQRADPFERLISQEIRARTSRPGWHASPSGSRPGTGRRAAPGRAARNRCSRSPRRRALRAGLGLDPAVQHRVRRLVDQDRGAEPAQDRRRLARLLGRVGRDAGVQRLALPHRGVERAHRLLERRLRIETVRVEDVDVVEAHSAKALVEAREQVLPGAPFAVRPRPHVVAGLRRDHELVAIRGEVLAQDAAEVLLGRAVRRPVVVGEIEVRDAQVERATHDRAALSSGSVATEVLPEPERDGRKQQPAPTAAVVGHPVVPVRQLARTPSLDEPYARV